MTVAADLKIAPCNLPQPRNTMFLHEFVPATVGM